MLFKLEMFVHLFIDKIVRQYLGLILTIFVYLYGQLFVI